MMMFRLYRIRYYDDLSLVFESFRACLQDRQKRFRHGWSDWQSEYWPPTFKMGSGTLKVGQRFELLMTLKVPDPIFKQSL